MLQTANTELYNPLVPNLTTVSIKIYYFFTN